MFVKFKYPDRKSDVTYRHVESIDSVVLDSDQGPIGAWLITLRVPFFHGLDRIFIDSRHELVTASEDYDKEDQ